MLENKSIDAIVKTFKGTTIDDERFHKDRRSAINARRRGLDLG